MMKCKNHLKIFSQNGHNFSVFDGTFEFLIAGLVFPIFTDEALIFPFLADGGRIDSFPKYFMQDEHD